ncbi:MAG: hypothetical protein A4E71_00519 [Smithella sp. PtaU1.Bin162]|nr:MAG: hypothetical protein A4E71_00519 [Smithella sp. PtaU1.Bin162]
MYDLTLDINAYNEKRLKEQSAHLKALQRTVETLADLSERKALTSDEAKGLFEVIRDYGYGLDILDDYDYGRVKAKSTATPDSYHLTYEDAVSPAEFFSLKMPDTHMDLN